jgi:hypothetical protein
LKGLLRAIKGLAAARKGFRWSLYFVHKSDGLRYALHENAVAVLLGYVVAKVENGKHIGRDWDLHVNFNWEHKAIRLEERHFQDGNISPELLTKIAAIDPGWMVQGGRPMFVDARTEKELRLGWAYETVYQRADKRASIEQMLQIDGDEHPTLASVMSEVFGEED